MLDMEIDAVGIAVAEISATMSVVLVVGHAAGPRARSSAPLRRASAALDFLAVVRCFRQVPWQLSSTLLVVA